MESITKTFDTLAARCRLRLPRGSFGHNVLLMFAGTAIGQFGSVLLAPALTRLYAPEMFGVLGMFTAALGILSVIAALRYELALPLASSDQDAANLLALCIAALAATTALGGLLVAVLPWQDARLGLAALAPYRWLLPVGFFCIAAYHVMVYYATRRNAFDIIARTKLYQGAAGPLSQLGFGLAGLGAWGLLAGFVIGQSTGVGLLYARLVAAPRALTGVTLAGMRAMAVRFKRFPLFSSWSGLLEAAGGSYMLLVAAPLLYSHAVGGFVFLADRVIGRPLLLVSTSILQVYVGDISKSLGSDPASTRRRFLQLAGRQALIVAAWLLLVNLLAAPLFPWVFGQEWEAAVPYLHVLSIAYLPQMVMHALMHTLQLLERQGLSAAWETGRLLAVLAAFAAGHALGLAPLQGLLIYSLVQAGAQIILFLLMYRSIQSLQKENHHA